MLMQHDRFALTLAELRDVARSKANPHSSLSYGIRDLILAVRSRERITPDQRDELGYVLDEISAISDNLLVGEIDRGRLDDGIAALISLTMLWGEDPEHRRCSDDIADAYAHARLLQNWAHNVCLAREILGRAEKRQKAFADRYLAPHQAPALGKVV